VSSISRLFAPLTSAESYRTLLFLLTALPLGVVGAIVLLTGWTVGLVLIITPLVVPVLVAFRPAVGSVAQAEAAAARTLLRITVRTPLNTPSTRGFWGSAIDILGDRAFWKHQAYLFLRFTLGWALAIGEVVVISTALSAIVMPIYYRWTDTNIAGWQADTFWKAALYVPAGIVALLIAAHLLRPLAALSRWLAWGLLDEDAAVALTPNESAAIQRRTLAASPAVRRRALATHAAFYAGLNALLILIWALTSRGYFWPKWTLICLGLPLAIHAWVELVDRRPGLAGRIKTRALAIHIGVFASFALFFVFVWLAAGAGYFWPVWPIIGLGLVLLGHRVAVFFRRVKHDEERIESLEATRAGAVDEQENELRRIERDLHDGAQARLVALGISIGMAEQKLAQDPDAARELLADARRGASEALAELRDLARGIHPPVLADRGVGAAVATLADRNPLDVEVSIDIPDRPPPAVETACYFVVAEALANATKHAEATHVAISVQSRNDKLFIEVVDDGKGGADASGAGLTGLARRVQVLDGSLALDSPAGGPTTLRAELPCKS
jgi:signal transduction histidine kinase